MDANTLWTIGHSTRSITDFLALLKENKIEVLADIRSLPGSRKYPQYNQENLSASLEKAGMEYQHLKGLGGLRKKVRDSQNTVWRNASFRAYADYMETQEFKDSAARLMETAKQKRVCICCSEAVWWRCHRSMIADYFKSKGWHVLHILRPGKIEAHPYTQPARIISGKLVYGSRSKMQKE